MSWGYNMKGRNGWPMQVDDWVFLIIYALGWGTVGFVWGMIFIMLVLGIHTLP